MKEKKTQENLEKLSEELTQWFYGEKSSWTNTINGILLSATSNTISAKLKQFMLSNNNNQPSQTQVNVTTVTSNLDNLRQQLNSLVQQSMISTKDVRKIRNIIKNVEQNILKAFRDNLGVKQIRLDGSGLYKGIDTTNISFLLNLMDVLAVTPTQSLIGEKFEETLKLYFDNYTIGLEKAISNKIIDVKQLGDKIVARDLKKGGETIQYDYVDEGDNISTSYSLSFDPFAAKQGKIDVKVALGTAGKPDLRLSAKSWGDGSGDLGSTSIAAAIMRISGKSVAECYQLAVLRENTKIPHEYAPYAIKADIAMGLTQTRLGQAGWANVLVIDDRAHKCIKCVDLTTIVEKAILSGYDENDINKQAHDMLDLLDAKGIRLHSNARVHRTPYYFGLMTKHLDDLKVTINTSSRAVF